LLMVGANVTMLCSSLMRHGVNHLRHVEREVREWMEEHEYRIHTAKIQGFRAKATHGWGVRPWASTHDRDHHLSLPGAPDAPNRVVGLRPAPVSRMVLLCSGADSTSRAPSRLE
jgi:hypothetical protein